MIIILHDAYNAPENTFLLNWYCLLFIFLEKWTWCGFFNNLEIIMASETIKEGKDRYKSGVIPYKKMGYWEP
ncbi:MAG: ribulose-bisphosphate carboxylase large subunit, partial [Pseudomonadota bacterium]